MLILSAFFSEKYAKLIGLEPGLQGKTFIVQVITEKNYMIIADMKHCQSCWKNVCYVFILNKKR